MKISHLGRKFAFVKELTLDNYIFSVFLFLMLLTSCVSILGNLLTAFPMVANIKWLFCIVLCVVGYILLYKQLLVEVFKILLFLSALFFVILPSWFYGGGDNTITLLYLIMMVVEAFLMLKSRVVRCVFVALCLITCIALLTISYHYPHLVQTTAGQDVYTDSIIQLIIIFVVVTISIAIYTSRYRRQHNLLTTLNASLEKLSITDSLSDTYNRRKITGILAEICSKDNADCSVVMLDIDFFKKINDDHGHLVGDAAIRHVADHLVKVVGQTGYVGRYGGDEFLLVLGRLTDSQAAAFAEKLLRVPAFDQFALTLSGGISRCTSGESCDELIHAADENLLLAKKKGKNNVCW